MWGFIGMLSIIFAILRPGQGVAGSPRNIICRDLYKKISIASMPVECLAGGHRDIQESQGIPPQFRGRQNKEFKAPGLSEDPYE